MRKAMAVRALFSISLFLRVVAPSCVPASEVDAQLLQTLPFNPIASLTADLTDSPIASLNASSTASPALSASPEYEIEVTRGRDGRPEMDGGATATTTISTPQSPIESARATGDPHLENIHGQKFDLMKPGKHVLLNIPRGRPPHQVFLRVTAEAKQLGAQCADMYFQELNITGAWADISKTDGFRFRAAEAACDGESRRISFGRLKLKVANGCTLQGVRYINFYVQHLSSIGFAVGGLLGEDDHTAVEIPLQECGARVSLFQAHRVDGKPGTRAAVGSLAETV